MSFFLAKLDWPGTDLSLHLKLQKKMRQNKWNNSFQWSGHQAIDYHPPETRISEVSSWLPHVTVLEEFPCDGRGRAPWVQEMELRVCCLPAWKNMREKPRVRGSYNNSTILVGVFNISLSAMNKASKQKTNRKQKTWTTLNQLGQKTCINYSTSKGRIYHHPREA